MPASKETIGAIARIQERAAEQQFNQTISSVYDTNPDENAQNLAISRETGMPMGAIRSAPEAARKHHNQFKIRKSELQKKNRRLFDELRLNRDFAAVAFDDVNELAAAEYAARSMTRGQAGVLEETVATLKKQYAYLSLIGAGYGYVSPDQAADVYLAFSRDLDSVQRSLPDYMRRFNAELGAANTYSGAVGVALGNPKAVLRTSVSQLANMVMPLATSAGAGGAGLLSAGPAGGLVGSGLGAGVGTFMVEVGATLDQQVAEAGIDLQAPDAREKIIAILQSDAFRGEMLRIAQRKGIGTATVDSLFTMIGGKLVGPVSGATSAASKTGRFAGAVGVDMVGEGAGEGAGQYAAFGEVNPGEVVLEAFSAGPTSFIQTGISALAQQKREGIAETHRLAQKSKTIKRDPKAVAVVMNAAAEEDPQSSGEVYIDAEQGIEFLQSMDPEKREALLNNIPYLQDQLDDAIQNGEQFEIRIGDYTAFIASDKANDGIIEYVRFNPADHTAKELEQKFEEILAEITGMTDEEIASEVELIDRSRQVQQAYQQQLVATGMTDEQARLESQRIGAAYRVFSDRYGGNEAAQSLIDSLLGSAIVRSQATYETPNVEGASVAPLEVTEDAPASENDGGQVPADGGQQTSEPATGQEASPEPAQPARTAEVVLGKKPKRVSKAAIERSLTDVQGELQELTGFDSEAVEAATGIDVGFSFKGELPQEIQDALAGNPSRRDALRIIQSNTGRPGRGEDYWLSVGTDEFVRQAIQYGRESTKAGRRRKMIEDALNNGSSHPLAAFYAETLMILDEDGGRAKLTAIANPKDVLEPGDRFTVAGVQYDVVRDPDDGYLYMVNEDNNAIILDSFLDKPLPIDEGSLKVGAFNPDEIAATDEDLENGPFFMQSVTLRKGNETLRRHGLDPKKKHKVREVAKAIQERQRRKFGTIDRRDFSVDAERKMASWMVKEVMFEHEMTLDNPTESPIGWYTTKYQNALNRLAETIFPEFNDTVNPNLPGVVLLKNGENAKAFFTAIVAVLSDGVRARANMSAAISVYSEFRRTGVLPVKPPGKQTKSFMVNMANIQSILDNVGPDEFAAFLLHTDTVRNLKKLAKQRGHSWSAKYLVDYRLPYSAGVFGEKLGIFFANLMGQENYLTMDRWWVRTMGRYRGTLIPRATVQSLNEFAELYAAEQGIDAGDLTEEDLIAAVTEIRPRVEARRFKNMTDVETKANHLYNVLFVNLIDQPAGGGERDFFINVALRAQRMLARRGLRLSLSDIQAAMWYFEKRLYNKMGATARETISYEQAVYDQTSDYDDTGGRAGTGQPGSASGLNVIADSPVEESGPAQDEDYPAEGRILLQTSKLSPQDESDANFLAWAGTDIVLEAQDVNDFDFRNLKQPVVVKVYHGTNFKFEVFDAENNANYENAFGKVNYFTSSYSDASTNYTNIGPDLKIRIEQQTDQISDDWYSLDFDEFVRAYNLSEKEELQLGLIEGDPDETRKREAVFESIAKRIRVGSDPNVLEVYVKVANPFIVHGEGRNAWSQLFDREGIRDQAISQVADDQGVVKREVVDADGVVADDYLDLVDEAEWAILEQTENPLLDAIREIADEYSIDLSDLIQKLTDELWDGQYNHHDLFATIMEHGDVLMAQDYESGSFISGHIMAEVVRRLGYDSIILKDADLAFRSMGLARGTAHIHVFHANRSNIKSVQNRGTYDPANDNIYYQSEDAVDRTVRIHNAKYLAEVSDSEETMFDPMAPNTLYQLTAFAGGPSGIDKFSVDAIGSGRGVLAFGWGLYFSDLAEVTQGYADEFSGEAVRFRDGGDDIRIGSPNWNVNVRLEIEQRLSDLGFDAGKISDAAYSILNAIMNGRVNDQGETISALSSADVRAYLNTVLAELSNEVAMVEADPEGFSERSRELAWRGLEQSTSALEAFDLLAQGGMTFTALEPGKVYTLSIDTLNSELALYDSSMLEQPPLVRRGTILALNKYESLAGYGAERSFLINGENAEGSHLRWIALSPVRQAILNALDVDDSVGVVETEYGHHAGRANLWQVRNIIEGMGDSEISSELRQRILDELTVIEETADTIQVVYNFDGVTFYSVYGDLASNASVRLDGQPADAKLASQTLNRYGIKGNRHLINQPKKPLKYTVRYRKGVIEDQRAFFDREEAVAFQNAIEKSGGYESVVLGEPDAEYNYVIFDDRIIDVVSRKQEDQIGGQRIVRGSIRFNPEVTTAKITLYEDAKNASTLIHEEGHLYWALLNQIARLPDAETIMPEAVADMKTIRAFVGADPESSNPLTTEQEEKVADAFVVYLYEGRAPSIALRDAFRRFKAWLVRLFNVLKAEKPNIKLSPAVREVFDRMLATDDEISALETSTSFQPNKDVLELMTPSQQKRYIEKVQSQKDAAREKLLRRALRDAQRKKKEWYQTEKEAIRQEVEAQVNQDRLYRAEYFARHGVTIEEEPPEYAKRQKLSEKIIRDRYGNPVLASLPAGLTQRSKGADPDQIAEMFGFENGLEMLKQFAGMTPKDELVERMTEDEMVRRHGDVLNDGTIEREALAALHNEDHTEILSMEHTAITRRLQTPKLAIQTIRRAARERIRGLPLNAMNVHQMHLKAVKAAREFGRALGAGDLVKAAEWKRRQILAHAMFVEAKKAKAEQEKTLKLFDKVAKYNATKNARSRDANMVMGAKALLVLFSFKRGNAGNVRAYLDRIEQNDPTTYAGMTQAIAVASQNAKDYRALTPDELSDLRMAVENFWNTASRMKKIEIDGKLEDREKIEGELLEALQRSRKQRGARTRIGNALEHVGLIPPEPEKRGLTDDKTKQAINILGMVAALRRVEHWAKELDGFAGGVFTRYIWRPISNAAERYRDARTEMLPKLQGIIQMVESDITDKKIDAPEIGEVFTMNQLLAAMLHMGNPSNRRKMLLGNGYAKEDPETGEMDTSAWDDFVDRMNREGVLQKRHYDFMQAVWDFMEELKPGAQEAHRAVYGFYFEEVPAEELVTPYGSYRGGYVPVKHDPYKNDNIQAKEDEETLLKGDTTFMFPGTGRGFTKTREEAYISKGVALNLKQLMGHADDVLRFTHLQAHIMDVARMLMRGPLRDELNAVHPKTVTHMLIPWLQRAAMQQVDRPTTNPTWDKAWRAARKRSSMITMIGNVANTLQQLTGIASASAVVKPGKMLKVLYQFVQNPSGVNNMMVEKSAMMRNRNATQMFEVQNSINDMLINPSAFDRFKDWVNRNGYILQQTMQHFVDVLVWGAGYEMAVERGLSEKEAIEFADGAVRQTQGSFNPEDMSRFEAGHPHSRIWTMFYSYFNTQANMVGTEASNIIREFGWVKGSPQLFYLYIVGVFMPAVIAEAIIQGMTGALWEDEDDDGYLDDMADLLFGSQARFLGAMVPVVGQAGIATYNLYNSIPYDDRISTSPLVSTVEASTRGVFTTTTAPFQENISRREVRDFFTMIHFITGAPVGPLGRPAGYLWGVTTGEVEPANTADAVRGAVQGR